MFNKEQFLIIASMQNALQEKTVGPDWKEKTLDVGSAIYVEAAEAMNHYGWEWWKKQSPDLAQASIELVDILHFAFTGLIQNTPAEFAFEMLQNSIDTIPADLAQALNEHTFTDHCKAIGILGSQGYYGQVIYHTTLAAKVLGFDSDYLFNRYLGKNVLNSFRKANGYKEGIYVKMWNGVEDNVYLEGILKSFTDRNEVPTPAQIESELNKIYTNLTVPTN
jgi:dimeric dUTPase (all-alpha-NTP-PPase superfamily)